MKQNVKPWYHKGLKFKCTECGKCCGGSPGYVWLNEQEMQNIAKFLNLSLSEFKKRYVKRVGQRYSLLESKKNYDCIFLKDKKCQIYEVRPTQCRTFPFWPQNICSKQSWEKASLGCEGINEGAERVPFETIETQKLIQIGEKKSAD